MPKSEMTMIKSGSLRSKMERIMFEEYISRCRKSNVWGYTNNGKKVVIRYWANSKVTMEQRLEFFAHEIGHHMGKAYNDRVKEEKKAREFEVTAVIAHRLAKAILKEKRANK
jgi:peptide deformylase